MNYSISDTKQTKPVEREWTNFRKSLNVLLRQTELGRDEFSTADNIMLTGSGVPTVRWGSVSMFSANATGTVKGFGWFKNTASQTNELLAFTDEGSLVKQNGSSSTVIPGQSWPSGTQVMLEQLGGKTYVASAQKPLSYYDGSSLKVFATLPAPTGLYATNVSGVTGSSLYSWKVTTIGETGESTPSSNVLLSNLPQDLSSTLVRVLWTGVSGSTGYQVYRGQPGDETLLASVGASITAYVDTGDIASETVEPPLANTTAGINSPLIVKYKDRLIAVDANDRNKLLISGRYPYHDKFSWYYGGGYVYIDPDSGDDITGVTVQPGDDRIVVYKNYSHYAVELSTTQIGNFLVLDPQYIPISTSKGACNPYALQTVENDTFFFGRSGINVTGYEPNFLNVIRTNEISAKMRPYLDQLGDEDYQTACTMYVNNKFLLSFPRRKEILVYDRERTAFVGIWKLPWGVSKMIHHIDADGVDHYILGSFNSNQVYEFKNTALTDNGSAINSTLRLNKESFGDESVFKTIEFFYSLFRRVSGTVTVNLLVENRDGSSSVAKSFDVTGASTLGNIGWGVNTWGSVTWGNSTGTVVTAGEELSKHSHLFKSCRLSQVEIVTNQAGSTYELLKIKILARPEPGEYQSSQRV